MQEIYVGEGETLVRSEASLGIMAIHIMAGCYKDLRELVDQSFPAVAEGTALLNFKHMDLAEQLAELGDATRNLVVTLSILTPKERLAMKKLAGLGPRDRAAAIAFLMAQLG